MGKASKLLALAALVAAAFVWSAPAEAGAAPLPYRVLHEYCKGTCTDGFFPQGDQLVLDILKALWHDHTRRPFQFRGDRRSVSEARRREILQESPQAVL